MSEDLTRRRLFGLAGAVAGAAGLSVSGCALPPRNGRRPTQGKTLATTVADRGQGYVTRPDITPPIISITNYGLGPDKDYIFLNAPYSGPGHGGTIIIDTKGDLIWFGPNSLTEHRMNFDAQAYQGKPVLTYWQGLIVEGYGEGEAVLLDTSYNEIARVRAHGIKADFHELNVTPQNTVLLTAYRTHTGVDLSAVGGPSNGYLLSGVAQEIDIATGKLVFEWDSWAGPNGRGTAGVALTETYETVGPGDGGYGTEKKPFNYFHINSIAPFDDDHLLISGRNTWALYLVNKATGKIVWRMNGKHSDFTMGPRANFFWQHHVRPHADNFMTVFDNGSTPPEEKQSRGLLLDVNYTKMSVVLNKQFTHPGSPVVLSNAMGSVQLLDKNAVFVGWGATPRFSQFAPDGKLLLDGSIQIGDPSYRGFTHAWSGKPSGKPAAVAKKASPDSSIIFVSWNGATEVKSWEVSAGRTATSLDVIGTAPRRGFETAVNVPHPGPYFVVRALDEAGRAIGRSATIKLV
jgi:Arylsulfotransferase (ASST)